MSAKPKKKDLVKIDYAGLPTLYIDSDENWRELLELSVEEQGAAILTDFHFLIHLGNINLPHKIKKRFFQFFCGVEATSARFVAMDGLRQKRHAKEWDLLFSANEFHKNRESGSFKNDHEGAFAAMAVIAAGFSEIVAKRDAAALRRMVAIIENKGITPEGSRGGIGSEDRYMLEKFCELHLATRSLPTKKALREACGLGDRAAEKLASKRMKKLGLWGLPTEPEI